MLGMALGRREQDNPRHSPDCPMQLHSSGMGLLPRLAAQSLCSSPPRLLDGYLALDQSLHLCASVSLSVVGGGDGEGEDKIQRVWRMHRTRKEPAGEGWLLWGPLAKSCQLSSTLGREPAGFITTNNPEMAVEPQCPTTRQPWPYALLAGGMLSPGYGSSGWTGVLALRDPGWPAPSHPTSSCSCVWD